MSLHCFRCKAEHTPFNPVNVSVDTREGVRLVCFDFTECEHRELAAERAEAQERHRAKLLKERAH